jgi:hypothetical protein
MRRQGCRKVHNEELHNLNSSPNIIKIIKVNEDEIGRACSTNAARRGMRIGHWLKGQRERDY